MSEVGLVRAPPDRVTAALEAARDGNALLGFAADLTDATTAGRASPHTRRATAFRAALPRLIDEVGAWSGTRERRVAASLVVLGYSARLLGPSIAVLLKHQLLVDTRPAGVLFDFTAGTGFRLGLADPVGYHGRFDLLLTDWRRDVLDEHLTMVIDAVRENTQISSALLWGNVASGTAGTLNALLPGGGVPTARLRAFVEAVLGHGPLYGVGRHRLDGNRVVYRRRNCCLYYRLPNGGYCGDCALPLSRTDRNVKESPR